MMAGPRVALTSRHALPLRRELPPMARTATTEPNATVVDRLDVSPTIARFRILRDDGAARFRAGQYVALGLPGRGGHLLQRPYSAASRPGDLELDLLVRLVPHGALTPRLWQLRPGSRVRLGPPRGLLALDPACRKTHLLLATGTGLAPFLAMLHELAARRDPPRTVLVHGAACPEDLAGLEELRRRAVEADWFRYLPAISRVPAEGRPGWEGAVGRVHVVLDRAWDELDLRADEMAAFLCGNPGMIAGGRSLLARRGVPEGAVHAEEYWAPLAAAQAVPAAAQAVPAAGSRPRMVGVTASGS